MGLTNLLHRLSCHHGMIASLACAFTFNLSAQTYYRVHQEEFANTAAFMNENKDYFTFIIVSPENSTAFSSSTDNFPSPKLYITGIPVKVSDDQELVNVESENNELGFTLESTSANSDLSQFNVRFHEEKGYSELGVVEQNSSSVSYRFDYEPTSTPSSINFKVMYDADNDGFVQIRSGLKNSDNKYLSIECSEREGKKEFRMQPNDYNRLGIYRLDLFNWSIDDSKVEDTGLISLTSAPDDILAGRDGINVHYILNDGDDVTFEQLVNSPDMVSVSKFSKGDNISLDIPTNDVSAQSRALTDTHTTLWALPVIHVPAADNGGEESTIPLGGVINRKYADDGISVGIVTPSVDEYNEDVIYYTIDGRIASQPLLPGVYVRRSGNKVDKIFVK